MDFAELESIEGLRWSWNSWPSSPAAAADLVIPLSIMYTPLTPLPDIPLLPYDPLHCSGCRAVINPYARVDYQSAVWICPLCQLKNTFPRSYAGVGENSLPAELFPTYSTVEYNLSRQSSISGTLASSRSNSSPNFFGGYGASQSGSAGMEMSPAFVFVLDICSPEDELQTLKTEILHVLAQLPESCLVGLISFDSMVAVHDLAFSDCSRAVLLSGERDLPSDKIQELLAASNPPNSNSRTSQSFLPRISDCEFRITTAIEEISSSSTCIHGHRPRRATGAAISTAVAILEASSLHNGARIMVFTSGPATIGPGMVVETDLSRTIRTHRDLLNTQAPLFYKARIFYDRIAERLSNRSIILDLFACSLDQVGAAEMRAPVETSCGFLILAESFSSDQFKKSLKFIFKREEDGSLNMNFNADIEIVATKDIKISSALGPLKKKKNQSESWKLCGLTSKTCVSFFFEICGENQAVGSAPVPGDLLRLRPRSRRGRRRPPGNPQSRGEPRPRRHPVARRHAHPLRRQVRRIHPRRRFLLPPLLLFLSLPPVHVLPPEVPVHRRLQQQPGRDGVLPPDAQQRESRGILDHDPADLVPVFLRWAAGSCSAGYKLGFAGGDSAVRFVF